MDDGINPYEAEAIPELSIEDVRPMLNEMAEKHDCPELVVAYDAVMDAIKACEDKPELMQDLSVATAPLMAMAPQLMMKMMGMG